MEGWELVGEVTEGGFTTETQRGVAFDRATRLRSSSKSHAEVVRLSSRRSPQPNRPRARARGRTSTEIAKQDGAANFLPQH
jgi:hypothetical protein